MERDEIVTHTAALRRELADRVESLSAGQLATPSLCSGWDVLTCAGHMAYTAGGSALGFVVAVTRYGGPHRAHTGIARATARRGPASVARPLRENAAAGNVPPVVREHGPLTVQIVHGVDIPRPLGLDRSPDPAPVAEALRFLTGGHARGFVRKGWLDGLRIEAGDGGIDQGEGPALAATRVEVAAALGGRTAVLTSLAGDGVEVLRARLT